jgi:hypothetical protein
MFVALLGDSIATMFPNGGTHECWFERAIVVQGNLPMKIPIGLIEGVTLLRWVGCRCFDGVSIGVAIG